MKNIEKVLIYIAPTIEVDSQIKSIHKEISKRFDNLYMKNHSSYESWYTNIMFYIGGFPKKNLIFLNDYLPILLKHYSKSTLKTTEIKPSEDGKFIIVEFDKKSTEIVKEIRSAFLYDSKYFRNNAVTDDYKRKWDSFIPHITLANFQTKEETFKCMEYLLDSDMLTPQIIKIASIIAEKALKGENTEWEQIVNCSMK